MYNRYQSIFLLSLLFLLLKGLLSLYTLLYVSLSGSSSRFFHLIYIFYLNNPLLVLRKLIRILKSLFIIYHNIIQSLLISTVNILLQLFDQLVIVYKNIIIYNNYIILPTDNLSNP